MDTKTRETLIAKHKDGSRVVAEALACSTEAELDALPIQASFEAFRATRRATAEILEQMTEAQRARQGTHSESSRYSPERWLEIYLQHAHTHAEQIRTARAAA
jgi:hypothetical protein